jgi:hypothetical protein
MEDKILVSLGAGQSLQELAADLLALADDPHDVESSPRSGGFLVPETLAGRYALAAKPSANTEEPQAEGAKKTSARTRRSRTPAADTAATTETKTPTKAKTASAKTGSKTRSRGKQSGTANKGAAKGEAGVSDG